MDELCGGEGLAANVSAHHQRATARRLHTERATEVRENHVPMERITGQAKRDKGGVAESKAETMSRYRERERETVRGRTGLMVL